MSKLLILLPFLDEDLELVKKNISICFGYLSRYDKSELILLDGGSNPKKIKEVIEYGKRKENKFPHISFYSKLVFPLITPNKNVGIMNGLFSSSNDNIIIIDSDFLNLTESKIKKIADQLIINKKDFVVADLKRSGGRSNRLLGNPAIRLFFPEIYKHIPYPYPGIIAIKRKILKRILKEDYCFDWGGEAQIAINGYFMSKGNMSSVYINKKDKKRKTDSMIKDAYQIYRSNILLAIKYKRFPNKVHQIDTLLHNAIFNNRKEYSIFMKYYNRYANKERYSLEELYKYYSDLFLENPLKIYYYFLKHKLPEIKLVAELVARPLLEIFFNISLKNKPYEIDKKKINYLQMKKISPLGDIVLSLLIRIYLKRNPGEKPFKDLKGMLRKSNPSLTEFRSLDIKKYAFGENIKGINIKNMKIEEITSIINKKGINNLISRNDGILSIIQYDELGKIDGKKITFDLLKFKEDNINVNKDLFVKLSIMATIAGYLKKDKININSEEFHKYKLEEFISYVLNNKKFAPRNYNIDLAFYGLNKEENLPLHDYNCVVLFSGGIDSTAALLNSLDKKINPLLLWVGFGQKNEEDEYKSILNVSKIIRYPVSIIRFDLNDYINEGWKEWDYIIPARNFMLVSFAASFLSRSRKRKCKIFLAAHEEEINLENTDKSRYFFEQCTFFFSKYYNKKIIVDTPFSKLSKSEVLRYWKDNWLSKYNISPYDTTTCYYGRFCGECKACLKRTLALIAGGFDKDPLLLKNPMKDENGFIRNDLIKRFESFSEKRKLEMLIAIKMSLDEVPDNVKLWYNKKIKDKSIYYLNANKDRV
ncbi:MAG TPA: 7-cyano-7-deazaguanine synthase [Candidatus Nanoarchaeia archaeon]|nr:7-cyano-7-deazaguanine synthase [Candidatus Nanoarchaeia archaeon]